MAKHTPVPWIVRRATPQAMRRCELGPDGWVPIAEREEGQFICIIVDCDEWQGNIPPYGAIAAIPGTGPEAMANANFIVTAVNAHDDLLAALEVALTAAICPCCGRDNSDYPDTGCTSDDCPGVAAIALV